MLHLRKFVAPEFVFGADARLMVARYAVNLGGSRPLMVSDAGVRAAGWVDEAQRVIADRGMEATLFDQVSPNPRIEDVEAGARVYRESGCDIIIALGGGSVIDCAKGIGILAANGGHVLDYEGIDKVGKPGPPLVCIPTTAGSAADVSQFALITDREARRKVCIISKAVVPDVSLIDPVTTTTLAPDFTAAAGMDALVHAIEAYVSRAHSPVVDLHALEAIRLIRQHLSAAVAAPLDLSAREPIMRASMHAGLAFSNASLGAVHAMSHSLGGAKDLVHGACNAALVEHVVAFNFPECPERFDAIGQALGCHLSGLTEAKRRKAIVEDIIVLKRTVGMTGGAALNGIHRSEIPELASEAIRDICLVTNPRAMNKRDIEVLYEEAL